MAVHRGALILRKEKRKIFLSIEIGRTTVGSRGTHSSMDTHENLCTFSVFCRPVRVFA